MVTAKLDQMISLYGWRNFPSRITTREGFEVDISTNIWQLPIVYQVCPIINTGKIANSRLRWSLQAYIIDRIERVSTVAGDRAFHRIWGTVLRHQNSLGIGVDDDFREPLITFVEGVIFQARANHALDRTYETIRWYIWCAERYPELGFCTEYALQLDSLTIPGGPKGEAVRRNDPEAGPLHRTLELPLLINALRVDRSSSFEHLQQRAAVALSLALGRNPINLTYLNETDLVSLTPTLSENMYMVRMPRIKKRQLDPRDDLLDEYIEPSLAQHLVELVKKNRSIDLHTRLAEVDSKVLDFPRPLFINVRTNKVALASGQWKYAFNMTSSMICDLVQKFVVRHKIISPVTGFPLYITIRRLRYTLATNLAAEGISKRELARVLDHTDTQHVHVYFEIAGNIVTHLDKAAAKELAKYIMLFRGKVIDGDEEALNGRRDDKHLVFVDEREHGAEQTKIGVCGKKRICHLDPPYSCYLCPKFQPYRHADHEHVMERLLERREERINKYDQARVGVQLDDVITAVAGVIQICRGAA